MPDVGGIDIDCGSKFGQQLLVGDKVVKHAGEEFGLAGGGANLGRSDPGGCEESAEPLAIASYEGKRLNRKRFCLLPGA